MFGVEQKFDNDSVDGPYGEGLFHFVDGADEEYEYSYDENGNMTKDLNRGIEEIRYNFLNLPSKITFTEKNAYIRNMYDANGHKFKMITYANIPLVIGRAAPAKASAKAILPGQVADSLLRNNSLGDRLIPSNELPCVAGQTTYDYCGNIVYKNGIPTIYREDGFSTLARMRFPEFHYYIRDHQGNIRGVTDGRGNIEQQNDYYPFGGMMASSTGGAVQPYRYTGKELVRFQGLDWLDYGARWYDPAILRWNGVDKLAEKNNSVSAYTFCHDDPVNRVDPDGKDDYYTENGSFIYSDNKFTDHIIIRAINPLYKLFPTPFVNQYTYTRIEYADISAKAYSNIYTNILHNNGFDVTRLKNNRVSIVALEYNNRGDGPMYRYVGSYNKDGKVDIPWRDAPIASEKTNKGSIEVTATIFPKGDSDREYLSTVSNVISILGVHELTGHGIKGLKGNMHWKILDMQKRHSSWNNTTFKLRSLYEYLVNNNKEYNTK